MRLRVPAVRAGEHHVRGQRGSPSGRSQVCQPAGRTASDISVFQKVTLESARQGRQPSHHPSEGCGVVPGPAERSDFVPPKALCRPWMQTLRPSRRACQKAIGKAIGKSDSEWASAFAALKWIHLIDLREEPCPAWRAPLLRLLRLGPFGPKDGRGGLVRAAALRPVRLGRVKFVRCLPGSGM